MDYTPTPGAIRAQPEGEGKEAIAIYRASAFAFPKVIQRFYEADMRNAGPPTFAGRI
jgi:hypothetical protein